MASASQEVHSRRGPDKVVVIGESAGGLAALLSFVPNIPSDCEAAFFIVIHIPPYERTQLDAILSRHSMLPVQLAIDGLPIKAGYVYVGVPAA